MFRLLHDKASLVHAVADYSHDGGTGRRDKSPLLRTDVNVDAGGDGFILLLGIFMYIRITLSDGGRLDESDGAKTSGWRFVQLISWLTTVLTAW